MSMGELSGTDSFFEEFHRLLSPLPLVFSSPLSSKIFSLCSRLFAGLGDSEYSVQSPHVYALDELRAFMS